MTVDSIARRDWEFGTEERDHFGPVWQGDARTGCKSITLSLVCPYHLSLYSSMGTQRSPSF